jgi:hypothetical protein
MLFMQKVKSQLIMKKISNFFAKHCSKLPIVVSFLFKQLLFSPTYTKCIICKQLPAKSTLKSTF